MDDPLDLLQLSGFILVWLAFYLQYLWRKVDKGCDECPHCRAKIVAKEQADHDRFHAYMKIPKPDPKCNRCQQGWGK